MDPPAPPRTLRRPACDFTVFGGTGDLALRKLLPALYLRDRERPAAPTTSASSASPAPTLDDDGYRALVRDALADARRPPPTSTTPSSTRLLARLHHVDRSTSRDPDDWHLLHGLLKDGAASEDVIRVFYLAVAPGALRPDLRAPRRGRRSSTERSRVVLEKPIGTDLASARAVNDAVGRVFDEYQIFRIDHYLGKESVQNLLVTRFANTFLEPLWNCRWVDHVQITVAESLGVGERGGYYDRSGALRDMVQNHLLQLLCLVAMEPPTYVDRETVRDEKLKVLQALRPMTPEPTSTATPCAGQYAAGLVDGVAVRVVRRRARATPAARTETFVALRAEVQNWRWAGVPFYLRTGKRMDRAGLGDRGRSSRSRRTRCSRTARAPTEPNRLHIQVQPDEGMRLHMTAKEPGPGGIRLRPVSLDLSYAAAFDAALARRLRAPAHGRRARQPDPLHAPRRGRGRLDAGSSRSSTRWSQPAHRPRRYPAGTNGPTAADDAPRARRPILAGDRP